MGFTRILKILCFCSFCMPLSLQADTSISISFYSENLHFQYNESILYPYRVPLEEEAFLKYYRKMGEANYIDLLNQLLEKKRTFNLNDYLFYELVHLTVDKILGSEGRNKKTLTTWFLLGRAGYDVRLTHLRRTIYLYGHTKDNIYNVPIIEINDKEYVNLSDLQNQYKSDIKGEFYLVEFAPNRYGKAISFDISSLPKLKTQLYTRKINFASNKEIFNLTIKVDKTIIDLMQNYPLVDERYYLEAPLSRSTYDSMIPQLKKILRNKTELEAIEILLSLTRSSFKYKTDSEHFGKNKPMIPDEVIYYNYSDCEDRSALFYYLVKELLGLPMIIVDYPDHLTVGVHLLENIGKPLRYKGRRYTICDPTGPDNSCRVGIYPMGYEKKPYKIALSFR